MTSPRDLDDLDLTLADPQGALRRTASAGARVREAATVAAGLDLSDEGRPRCVVILGGGGQRDVARALAALAGPSCPVPVVTARELPAFVGPLDLVVGLVAPPGTGMPERAEQASPIVAALEEAARRGARLFAVAQAASAAAEVTSSARGAVVELPREVCPYWSLLVPAAMGLASLSLAPVSAGAIESAAARLDQVATTVRPDAEIFTNPAKLLAADLLTQPLLWATTPIGLAAAARGAARLRRVAGLPAVANDVGDAAETDLALVDRVGSAEADPLESLFRDRADEPAACALLVLRDGPEESAAAGALADRICDFARDAGALVHQLETAGEGRLERLASLVGLFDATAVYAAMAAGRDPALRVTLPLR